MKMSAYRTQAVHHHGNHISTKPEERVYFNGLVDPFGREIHVGKAAGEMKTTADKIVMAQDIPLVSHDPLDALIGKGYVVILNGKTNIKSLEGASADALATVESLVERGTVLVGKSTQRALPAKAATFTATI